MSGSNEYDSIKDRTEIRGKRIFYSIRYAMGLLIFFLLLSCGSDSSVLSPEDNYDPYLIEELLIDGNSFEITTSRPVDLRFSYFNVENSEEKYKGYSTDISSDYKKFSLPVSNSDLYFEIEIMVISSDSHMDTLLYFYSSEPDTDFLRVDFVDVAQGDGNLIRTPEGHAIAVDGGYGTYSPGWAPEQDWNGAGQPLMLNYVQNEDVHHFSYLIETHRHSDHWGGLQDIIDAGIEYDYYLSPQYTIGYQRGDYLNLDSAVSLQILNIGYPPDAIGTGVNNTSIVLKIVYGSTEYLLTGDAEREVELFLINSGYNLSANILKAGHHGSRTSSTSVFLAAVLNQFARVVTLSFGTGNPYGHPHSPSRFNSYETFGTNQPESSYVGSNFHFDIGTIKTYSDGNVLIIKY